MLPNTTRKSNTVAVRDLRSTVLLPQVTLPKLSRTKKVFMYILSKNAYK